MNRLCGRRHVPIHSIPCSVAQPLERGYKNYYSIIQGGIWLISKKPDDNLSFLYRAILMLQTEEECERFFDDLCTGPELKAIAQRLEVAKLLKEQNVYSKIVEKTGASTATISRVNRSLQYGANGYDIIFERLEQADGKL